MISVIMSVYNENDLDLSEAIDSILHQTYSDFEFIIVCDNPKNNDLIDLLRAYEARDKRVRLIINDENIGLALSLNRAAEQAIGEYLFRMDADDISYPYRMMEQYKSMVDEDLDLICSGYDIINEKSEITCRNVGYQQDETMRTRIPYQVTIHHPTVMMKKSFFESVGGYRNYICAQDYDLWLRMWYASARMKILNKTLLKYRIRESSVTNKKRFIQKLTTDYIKELFWQRLQTGSDNYSYDDYLSYLERNGAYDNKKNESFLNDYYLLSKANSLIRQGRCLRGRLMRIKVFLFSAPYRKSYLSKLKTKKLVKAFLKFKSKEFV